MITHALFRNTVLPFFMSLHLIQLYTRRDYTVFYSYLHKISFGIIPIYTLFVFMGFFPLEWVIYPTWNSHFSIFQYLFYMVITNTNVYLLTKHRSTSWTLTAISAGASGYLYEIPYWIKNYGLTSIIRTAKTSFLIFDFGFIAFAYMVFLLYYHKAKINKNNVFFVIIYLVYVAGYLIYGNEPYTSLFLLSGIPSIVFRRTFSMLMCYSLVTSVKKVNNRTV